LAFAVVVTILSVQLTVRGDIVGFKETKATVERARETGSWIERAALQQEVIRANTWLARVKYWNKTVFDLWIPDAVDDLEPIR